MPSVPESGRRGGSGGEGEEGEDREDLERAVPPEVRFDHSWVTVGSYVFPAKVASEHQASTYILGLGLLPGVCAQNPRKKYDPTVTQL